MEDAPLVSIVIRSIGRACVAEAIASVAAQQYRPLELVVVDASGGAHPPLPPTPTLTAARLASTGERLNRPRAANLGLDQARGEWIGFVDDDDVLEPTHVSRLLARTRQDDHPRVVHGQLWSLDRFHRVVQQRQQRFNPLIMLYNCQISAMSVLLHRSLRDAGHRMDETLETSEDWDLWLRLMPHARFGTVSEPTHFYLSEAGTSGTGLGRNRHNQENHLRFHGIVKDRHAAARDRLWAEHFARLDQGIELQREGRIDEALAFYAGLQEDYPDEPNTMYLKAQAHAQAGQLQTARLLFQQAIFLNGDAAEYRMALGDVCAGLGDHDEARSAYTGALRYNAALKADIETRLSRLPAPEAGSGNGGFEDAVISRNLPCPCGSGQRYKACHGSIAASGEPAGREAVAAALAEALALARSGQTRAAKVRYMEVVSTNPESAEAQHALALLEFDMLQLPLAEAHIMRAQELAPDDPQVAENRTRILGLRFERGHVERVTARLAAMPRLVREPGCLPAVARGTAVHIISPFENPIGGTELHALELKAILGSDGPVELWSTLPQVPAALASRGVRRLDPDRGEHPRDGVLVFMGTWQLPPAWVRACQPTRIVVMHNVDNAPALLDLVLALEAQSPLPIQVLMPSDSHRLRCGIPGAAYTTPINLARFTPPPAARGVAAQFTVGRVSRNVHTKFHPDEPALIRRLLAMDMAVRLLGATVLLRHFPLQQPLPGLTLLPPGAEDAATFLRGLDAFYYRTGPHWPETAGRVIAEAMACGLPVVCARSVGFAELIDHEVDGFVFEDNDDDAALRYLALLRDDPARRAIIGRAARAKAEACFGPKLHRRIRDLYLGAT